jgi:pyruvate formate lyase activating enzyme
MRPYVDIFLYDVKCLSGKQHILRTGVNNSPILANLSRLARAGEEIIVRLPIIPGFNDTVQQMEEMADFLRGLGSAILQVDLLPFHNWCQDKYRWLGMDWEFGKAESMDVSEVDDLLDVLEDKGLNATIGG